MFRPMIRFKQQIADTECKEILKNEKRRITGSADEATELFAKGQLKPNLEAKCNHHGNV
ncbi:MAG: hypothetical protein K6A15_03175 [Treponema sp.]|nr:hypothetical protein [Treponema sp.]